MCYTLAQAPVIFASENKIINLNVMVMNTETTLANISAMFTSEASYRTLVDMINDMELELMDVRLA